MSLDYPAMILARIFTVFTTVATPVTVEVLKDTAAERITVNSRGTIRRDVLGGGASSLRSGEPAKYLPGHVPVVPALPPGLAPVPKGIGKVLKENSEEREVKLVSGTIRTERR